MSDIPIVMGPAGRVNTSPSELRAALVGGVAATNPDYTSNLPGSLVEDIASTDVGALIVCDQALTELVNSITPYGANPFVLNQLGQIYGVEIGAATNTSVYVVFTGSVGYSIPKGFTVSDGTHQYAVNDGGIVGSGGSSSPLYCLAAQTGSWAVPPATVTSLVTSVPSPYTLTCTNPQAGIPSVGEETEESYRAGVLQAGLASAQGMPSFLRTQLRKVSGVQPRLIAIQQQSPGWKVIVGGGDPYDVAYAIYQGTIDVSNLVGSVMRIASITNANPGVATTTLNHGLTTGDSTTINAATGMSGINGSHTVTVIDEKTFSFGVDTTSSGSYTANSGYLTPNARNITADVIDYPDTYTVAFVSPPAQTVAIALTWNTSSPYAVSATAVAQVGAPALAAYVNSIPVGQPINVFELQNVFQEAVVGLVPTPLLTRMVFSVDINGVTTAPSAGTGIISGDPESYFTCDAADVSVTQG